MSNTNNEHLRTVEAARAGDKEAFEALYNQYRDRLFFFAKKYTGSREAAEDIVSETFITAMEKLPELRDSESFGGWLYSIAYRKCLDYVSANSRSMNIEEVDEGELNAPVMLPDDYAVSAHTKEVLRSVIDGLSPEMRSAVILYYYEEMSLSEVAASMHTNENAAKQKLFRARKTIKKQIEKRLGSGALMAAVPLGAMLNSTAEYAGLSGAGTAAAAGTGAAKLASIGFAGKAAALGAAAVLAVGIPVGLSKLENMGDTRSEDSSVFVLDSRYDNSSLREDNSLPEGKSSAGQDDLLVRIRGVSAVISGDSESRAKELLGQLDRCESDDLIMYYDGNDWELSRRSGGLSLARILTNYGWKLVDSSASVYDDSEELNALVMSALNSSQQRTETGDVWSVDCAEPATEEEYVDAAIKCTDAWLTSLQSEDAPDKFRNEGFTITKTEEGSGHQKCNYLCSGLAEGRKEFVVEICFTAEYSGEDTFYDDYYQEGRYTAAGTFWSGQYICGRFAYEEGKVTLLRYTTRDGVDRISEGLSGINESSYKTFYDFARRPDLNDAIEQSFIPYGRPTVSRNLTQTEDGKPINLDIYGKSDVTDNGDSYTTVWDFRTYMNGEAKYSTGVYFTDGGTGHTKDTLPKDFKLTFDNYDGDGNPDYCVRYDSDDNGTYYVLESIQTDGRVFNLSGRAYQGGIYIAGCTDPSPRLQRDDNHRYTGWKVDNGRYYPTDESGNEIELAPLNMYSERYYLPESIGRYSEDENSVTCFLWNNTGADITTDGTYSVEAYDDGGWKELISGLQIKTVTVAPRQYAEIAYDISQVTDRGHSLYRIVQKSGQLTAYGSFRCDGKASAAATATAEPLYIGSHNGTFTVQQIGAESVTATAAEIRDGDTVYPLTIASHTSETEGSMTYTYIASELPATAGSYTLVVNGSIQCPLTVTEGIGFEIPSIEASAVLSGPDISVTVTASEACRVNVNGVYKSDSADTPLLYDTGRTPDLAPGEPAEIKMTSYYEKLSQSSELMDQVYESYSDGAGFARNYNIEEGLSKEEFSEVLKDLCTLHEGDDAIVLLSVETGSGKTFIKLVKLG